MYVEAKIGPPLYITEEMISKATAKMKTGKAARPSGIRIRMIRSAGKKSSNLLETLQTKLSRPCSFRLEPHVYCQFIQG